MLSRLLMHDSDVVVELLLILEHLLLSNHLEDLKSLLSLA